MGSRMLNTYVNAASLLQLQKVAPIVGWKATKSIFKQWSVIFAVLWNPSEKHHTVYDLMLSIDAAEEVNA